MTLVHQLPAARRPVRVVVLGAGGFLGRGLAAALRARGDDVVALGTAEIDLAAPAAGDALAALLHRDDTLVFLAALTPDRGRDSATLMRNLAMARAVAAAARAVPPAHLVYASSDAVYPFVDGAVDEATPAAPADLYGAMHRTREILLAQEAGAPLAVLRFTAMFGAGDTHGAHGPNRFVHQALRGEPIVLIGQGEETRDHLVIGDAVAVLRAVIDRSSTGLVNVVSGRTASFRAVAEAVAARRPGARIEAQPRRAAITHRRFDPAVQRGAFPDLVPTPLGDALDAMLRAGDAQAGEGGVSTAR